MAASDSTAEAQLKEEAAQKAKDDAFIIDQFTSYLENLCAPLLNTHKQLISKAVQDPDYKDLINSFCVDESTSALIVQKISQTAEDPENAFLPIDGNIVFSTDAKILVGFEEENSHCIVFVKRNEGRLQKQQSLSTQVLKHNAM
jgi:hypothetical protein